MKETVESVKEYGVLAPAIARPREGGGYELVSGHRRKRACELAGLETMPVIIRNWDRDTAIIAMVDSNLQRENISPIERGKAFRMKIEAIKRRGARTDLTSPQVAAKFRCDDEVAKGAGLSGDTVRRYVRLTELSPELQQVVEDKKIALTPAAEISYLKPEEQALLAETIESEQATPSLSQAQRMKKMSQEGKLNEDTMLSVMSEQKKPEVDFLMDAITEWLKELLISGIVSNLSGLFDSVNQRVGEISTQVGLTPQAWNGGIFNMVRNLSNTVILPIAGIILTLVMTLELIQMLTERNNLGEAVCCKRCISSTSNTTYSQLICGRMI